MADGFSLTQAPSDSTTLMLVCAIPVAPAVVYAAWTQPDQITRWWPQTAEMEMRVGGAYHFGWPTINQRLRGMYQVVAPDTALTFTWRWDDDTEGTAPRLVALTFAPAGGGHTQMTLTHGPYRDDPDDQAVRLDHHLAGWRHFLPKLGALFETACSLIWQTSPGSLRCGASRACWRDWRRAG